MAYEQQKCISFSSGACKSQIRAPAWLGSGDSPLPGLQTAAFSLYPHIAFYQHVYVERGSYLSPVRSPVLSDYNIPFYHLI